MKKKIFFNMVEVLLALGVTAIGVTGLMGIIPIAMRANSDAQAEYFVSNAADSMYAWFEGEAREHGFSSAFSSLPTTKPEVSGTWSSMDRTESDITEDGVNLLDLNSSTGLAKVFVGKKNKLFADFTGDIAVWKNASQKIADHSVPTGTADTSAITRVFLEISWPSTSPYANRNKRVFVRDFVDPDAMLMEHSR